MVQEKNPLIVQRQATILLIFLKVMMEKIERQDALIKELTTTEQSDDLLKCEVSKCP